MFFGGWCAARLSGNPLSGDGMLHGVSTWGLATVATIAIVAVASWAVLREGINVLGTAAIAAEQVVSAPATTAPSGVIQPANPAAQAIIPQPANSGPMAQATANIISGYSLRICGGVLLGFITALLGGMLGHSRTVVLAAPEVIPVPSRRAA